MIDPHIAVWHVDGAKVPQFPPSIGCMAEFSDASANLPSITNNYGPTGYKNWRSEADQSRSLKWQSEPRPSRSRRLWRLSRSVQVKGRRETLHWLRSARRPNHCEVL